VHDPVEEVARAMWRRKTSNSWWRCLGLQIAVTSPVAISNAANKVVVPCRT
jgi:hypothetical protein